MQRSAAGPPNASSARRSSRIQGAVPLAHGSWAWEQLNSEVRTLPATMGTLRIHTVKRSVHFTAGIATGADRPLERMMGQWLRHTELDCLRSPLSRARRGIVGVARPVRRRVTCMRI